MLCRTQQKFFLRFRNWKRKSYATFHSIGKHITIGNIKSIVADTLLGKQKNTDTICDDTFTPKSKIVFENLDVPLFALQLMQLAPVVNSTSTHNQWEHKLIFSLNYMAEAFLYGFLAIFTINPVLKKL